MSAKLPSNIQEFFEEQMAALSPACACALVLDPQVFLDLGQEYVDPNGRRWRVYRYREDDLTFRVEYAAKPDDPNFPHIIWVSYPAVRRRETIQLSHIADIIDAVDDVIDVSLAGALGLLAPSETWQLEALATYSSVIAPNLATFVQNHSSLRRLVGKDAALGAHHVSLLALTCLQPSIDVSDLLFEETDLEELLQNYVRLLWLYDWQDDGIAALRAVVREGSRLDLSSLSGWLAEDREELAKLAYLWNALDRFQVPNPLNQLRGLGLVKMEDPASLVESIGVVIEKLVEDESLAVKVQQVAEDEISQDDLSGLVDILGFDSAEALMRALVAETAPAFVFGLATRYLQTAFEEGTLARDLAKLKLEGAAYRREEHVISQYSALADDAMQVLEAMSLVEQELAQPFEPHSELSSLIMWYTRESHLHSLRLFVAKARRSLKAVRERSLADQLEPYLDDLEGRACDRLEMANRNLADLIGKAWRGYASHPRLSINILRDTIVKKRYHPPRKPRVWILIFDGMRWDTWQEVVKPVLTQHFEIEDEKAYVCVLPSTTHFARTSLLAGNVPRYWIDHRGQPTTDHTALAAKLFNLPPGQRSELLRVTVAAGTDFGQRRLDLDVRPYNVLIYNLSDDWIHSFRYDVFELNEKISGTVEDVILPDLLGRIGEEDAVVIASDHGFVELSRDDGLTVRVTREWSDIGEDDPRNPVAYRYLRNLKHDRGLEVRWEPSTFHTAAVGKTWFRRKRGKFSRYAHGGISLQEMVVPGVLCRKIVAPKVHIALMEVPREIELVEDEPAAIAVTLVNRGNRKGDFVLLVKLNTGQEQKFQGTLRPGQEQVIELALVASANIKQISWDLSYTTVERETERLPKRRTSVQVALRKDKVELDLGALDRLDE